MCRGAKFSTRHAQYTLAMQINLSLHQHRAVHERTHRSHCGCSCLLRVVTPVAESLIDDVTPFWDNRLVLRLQCFPLGDTDGNETTSCTEHLLAPRRKDDILWDMSDETENLAQGVVINICGIVDYGLTDLSPFLIPFRTKPSLVSVCEFRERQHCTMNIRSIHGTQKLCLSSSGSIPPAT